MANSNLRVCPEVMVSAQIRAPAIRSVSLQTMQQIWCEVYFSLDLYHKHVNHHQSILSWENGSQINKACFQFTMILASSPQSVQVVDSLPGNWENANSNVYMINLLNTVMRFHSQNWTLRWAEIAQGLTRQEVWNLVHKSSVQGFQICGVSTTLIHL